MRCNNCGWPNPEGAVKCQKCNQLLFSEDIIPEQEEDSAPEASFSNPLLPTDESQSKLDPNKTVMLSAPLDESPSEEPKQESVSLPKRTVFVYGPGNSTYTKDAPVSGKKAGSLRSTMVDIDMDDLQSMCETIISADSPNGASKEVNAQENKPSETDVADSSKPEQHNCYELTCMDGNSTISLISSCPLDVKSGDILLISGLRFKAN